MRGDFIWWLSRSEPQRFRAFWKAGGDVESAAQSSFGQPLPELLHRYLATHVHLVRSGPSPPERYGQAIAWVMALTTLVAFLLAHRRVLA